MEPDEATDELVLIKTEVRDTEAIDAAAQDDEANLEFQCLQKENEISFDQQENVQGFSSSCGDHVGCQTSDPSLTVVCGGCGDVFNTICQLHEHIKEHGLGGSYFYDHRLRTAFPRYDSACASSQTNIKVVNPKKKLPNKSTPSSQRAEGKMKASSNTSKVPKRKTVQRKSVSRLTSDKSLMNTENSGEQMVKLESSVSEESVHSDQVDHIIEDNLGDLTPRKRRNTTIKIDSGDAKEELAEDTRKNKRKNSKTKIDSSDVKHKQMKEEMAKDTQDKTEIQLDDDIQKYSCYKCKLVFISEEFFQVHMQKHQGSLLCDCCGEVFHSLEELRRHVLDGEGRESKAMEIHECSFCGLVITELKGLRAHWCLSDDDDKSQNKKTLRFHIRNLTKKRLCEYAPPISNSSEDTPFTSQCEVCHLYFENDFFLTMHSALHWYPNRCSKCNLHFKAYIDRDHHVDSCVDPDTKWICAICGRRFNGRSGLVAHINSHKDTKDVQCDMCGKALKSKVVLKCHMRRCPALDSIEKRFECEICHKKFLERCRKRDHMNTVHSDIRPFVCDECGSSFKSRGLLKRHEKTHEENRPKVDCEICGVGFRDMTCLKRHKKRHSGALSERCTYCGKMFHDRWNLKAHMRQHTGEKPYKCDVCGQGFTHNVSRKNHQAKCGKQT